MVSFHLTDAHDFRCQSRSMELWLAGPRVPTPTAAVLSAPALDIPLPLTNTGRPRLAMSRLIWHTVTKRLPDHAMDYLLFHGRSG